jgi:hypothetical protein
LTDHDRRIPVLLIFCAIAAGSAAAGELLYLLIRWAAGS